MRRIRIPNSLIERTYTTYVDADYSSGTSLTVASNVSFATNDLIVIGNPREEFAELKKVNSLTGVTGLVLASALNFYHPKGTPIYKVLWDFVSIERSVANANSFSVISSSPIQWDNRNNETVYYDSTGSDSFDYRYRFYNSVTDTYSEYSVTISGARPAANSVRAMLAHIRAVAGDIERKIIKDDYELIRQLAQAETIIYATNPKYWFLKVDTFKQNSGIAATSNTSVYSLATYTDFGHLDTLRYKYNTGGSNELYHLKKKGELEFDALIQNQNRQQNDRPYMYKLLPPDASSDPGYFQVDPVPQNNSVGTFYPNYYKKIGLLDAVDDETSVPLPNILEDYGIMYVEKIKGNEERAKIYEERFYGPTDLKKRTMPLTGIMLLDKLNIAQKGAAGQSKSIKKFLGRNPDRRNYGYRSYSEDRRINEW